MTATQVLEQIQTELAALPDPQDLPNTVRAQEEAAVKRRSLEARANAIRQATSDIARLDPRIAALEKWLAVLKDSRQSFSDELTTCGNPDRNHRAQDLQLAIQNIDQGCETAGEMTLMAIPLGNALRAAGYSTPPNERSVWSAGFGSLPNTERQLETLRKRRAVAQALLDQELGVTTAQEAAATI